MKSLLAVLVIAAATSVAADAQDPSAKPQAPSPIFRAGVELVSVDVTALDSNGRQVTDLTAGDFQIEIDGDKRQVATVEYIRSADPLRQIGAPHKVVVADETFSTSNAKGAPRGRLITLLIDQGNIRTGAARSAMNSAKKFVDTLTPEDRVSVVAVPGPGELVDFTTNHDKVREALLRIVGTGDALRSQFNLSMTEALALYMHSNAQLASEVILRVCGATAGAEFDKCQREVDADAAEIANEIRRRTTGSLHGMRSVLQSLGAIEGPKSVILISEGLVFEGLGGETDDLAAIAADSRASIDVLLLDVPRFDATQSFQPNTPREDRDLQTNGLEQLAGASRGDLYRINTTAEYAFDKISRALDGYYLVGVEARPDDRNGRRHRIGVKSLRRGVSMRSRRSFVTTMSAKATTPTDAVTRALRSPLPINDLPLEVSTWTYKQPGTGKVRVIVAAEVERLASQPLEYTVGMALVNKQGRGVAQPVEKKQLIAKPGDEGTAVFSGMLAVDPGEYRVIVSMADSEGRVGSVSRAVTAFQMDGPGLTLGDLLVGSFEAGAKPSLEPTIEPAVSGTIAVLMEAYSSSLGTAGAAPPFGLEATLDILTSEDGAPLASIPMRIGAGSSPEIANVSAQVNTSSLPPGRYLARGSVRQSGKPQGHMLRPFRIIANATDAGAAAPTGMVTQEVALVLLGGVDNFDRKTLLTPAMLTSMFTMADDRATGSRAAVKEARGGDLGAAAITALAENDQVLATFLKGLELYQSAQLDKAAMQFQNSMQMAPTFAPSRLFLGAALAAGNRHKEAAGLIQSTSTNPPNAAIARLAGEEWIKAGQPALAIPTLERAMLQAPADMIAKKLLGIAYVLGGRSSEAVPVLTTYLDANPMDAAALLSAIFGTYQRHLTAPQPATLAADRANLAKWSKAYVGTKGPMQPLVAAWVKHVHDIK
jgi:VWFA-related protein